ncbi:MAG: DUF624 domain-containing protein [Bifidobacterium sp.]|uniref:DUF624 domain-containing protein n=1 Tax=Bifidobacterium fermentum TaxID=3059035 RepID=A0AB39UNL8_9BIFI
MLSRFSLRYERICRMIVTIFAVNVAMVAHTLLGAVIVGFFPSIAAAHSTYRLWLLSSDRVWSVRKTWSTFHGFWKGEIRSANEFGWSLSGVWLLLIVDYWMVNWHDIGGTIGIGISGALVVIMVFVGMFTLLSWVLRSNFNESNRWAIKTTLQMVVARPLCSLITAALFMLTVWAWYTWPGILVVFGLSVPAFLSSITVFSYARLPGMDIHGTRFSVATPSNNTED